MLFVADGTRKMSVVLFFVKKFIKRLHRSYLYIDRRASAYFAGIFSEHIDNVLRLDKHIYSIVIVSNDFICVTFAYHILEFGIGYFLACTSVFAGKVKESENKSNNHVQPAQAWTRYVDLGFIVVV